MIWFTLSCVVYRFQFGNSGRSDRVQSITLDELALAGRHRREASGLRNNDQTSVFGALETVHIQTHSSGRQHTLPRRSFPRGLRMFLSR